MTIRTEIKLLNPDWEFQLFIFKIFMPNIECPERNLKKRKFDLSLEILLKTSVIF